MMKTPEQSSTPMINFRFMLSWTFHSSGSGMQTITKSVLGCRLTKQSQRRQDDGVDGHIVHIRQVQYHEGEVVRYIKRAVVSVESV